MYPWEQDDRFGCSPSLHPVFVEKQAQDFIVEQNAELLNNNGSQILDVLASGIAQKGLHLPGGKKKDAERLASDALFKAGIPGIKYLDNASRSQQFVLKLDVRGKPYETEPIYARNLDDAKRIEADYKEKGFGVQINDNSASNYVIFDDSMIKILEKYGIVGPVAISAMALGEDES